VILDDKRSFWTTLGRALAANNKHVQLREISSARDFGDAFQDDSAFGGRRAVLIIDEFDGLCKAPPDVSDSVLDILRDMKQAKKDYLLHVPSLFAGKNTIMCDLPHSFLLVSCCGRHVQNP